MKSIWRFPMVAGLALGAAACAGGDDDAVEGPAPEQAESASAATVGYHVITFSSNGGTRSIGNSINNLGWIAGTSNLPEDTKVEATLWLFGLRIRLGTLGGDNSGVLWPVKNNLGIISGIAETGDVDPYGEAWSCSAFFPSTTGHVCRGFVWERGVMRKLGTFGGTHGFATGTNNYRQTVGWAENTVRDPSCNEPQIFQFRAALWGPGRDQLRELPPLPDDSTSAATGINDRGQVIGISGTCANAVGEYSARHAVMWENGTPTDLGNIGGVAWNTPMAINQRGDVVGFANAPDTDPPNDFNVRAFRWNRAEGMKPLEVLGNDVTSQALGINEWGQIVGVSTGATTRAFIRENGVITDLNTLVVSGSHEPLRVAGDINDFGIITGSTRNPTTLERLTFMAIPIRRHH